MNVFNHCSPVLSSNLPLFDLRRWSVTNGISSAFGMISMCSVPLNINTCHSLCWISHTFLATVLGILESLRRRLD
uniref:AlNc14C96G5861 protein n=1 Tax=Albugo laibachii Nc14 TaxID=890382 RepID=F0WGY5_9STRA|nr:AlNc14C96G5861 [Albugo laibachii Nc14]|eukprot:CCA20500.1 AlNc14C96G5861 [Albugo laibachii Nc14]